MRTDDIEQITFTVAACAKALGISEDSVRKGIRDGSVPAVRIGHRVLVLRQDLIDRIQEAAGGLDRDTVKLRAADAANCLYGYARIRLTEPVYDAEGTVTGSTSREIDVPGYDPRHPVNVERSRVRNAAIEAEARELGYAAPVIV